MNYRFYIDPETNLPHIDNHGVREEEVRQAFLWPGEGYAAARESRIRLGRTSAGRYLQIVYVEDENPDSIFVITAYELRGKPKAAFRRRQKRRGR